MASSEPIPQTVVPGDILADKYRIEHVLGRGGMGVVVAARHIGLGTRVAIKCLLPNVVDNPDLVTRFLREAQTASLIASEHVTRVLDVGTHADGSPFIVMEYLEGRDLASILRELGRIAITDAVDYALQACEALAVAHSAGIVHRDLKPANLFLTELPDGAPRIKILDFGISKKQGTEGDFSLTRTDSAIMGSPAYISPEQIRSQKRVDGRADIWSLGVSLFELLSGQLPFMAENLGGLIAAILADPPLPLRSIRPEVPPALEAVVHGCLEKSVAARPANVAVLAQALRPFGGARAAASVERTMGVVARTTGGSLTSVQAVSIATPRPAPPRARSTPGDATTTRPLGSVAATAAARDSRPMLPSTPELEPSPMPEPEPAQQPAPAPAAPAARGPWSAPEETRTLVHPSAVARTELHAPERGAYPVPAAAPEVHVVRPSTAAPEQTAYQAPAAPQQHMPHSAAQAPPQHTAPPAPPAPPPQPQPPQHMSYSMQAAPVVAPVQITGPSAAVTSSAWGQSAPASETTARRPPALWIGAGAALLVGGLVAFFALRGGGEPDASGSSGQAATAAPSGAASAAAATPPSSPPSESPSAPPAPGSAASAPDPSAAAPPASAASAAPSSIPQAQAKPTASPGAGKARPTSTSDLNKLIQNRK